MDELAIFFEFWGGVKLFADIWRPFYVSPRPATVKIETQWKDLRWKQVVKTYKFLFVVAALR